MKQRSDKNLGTKAGTEGERRGAGAQSERGRHADGCLDFFRLCHTGSAAQEANYRARKATEARRRELFDQAAVQVQEERHRGGAALLPLPLLLSVAALSHGGGNVHVACRSAHMQYTSFQSMESLLSICYGNWELQP